MKVEQGSRTVYEVDVLRLLSARCREFWIEQSVAHDVARWYGIAGWEAAIERLERYSAGTLLPETRRSLDIMRYDMVELWRSSSTTGHADAH
jgi:hypothetical protein